MSAREVVTIQCGHFSNFIGTHWWNIQESGFCYDPSSKEPREILHDCLFREGLTLTGQQTYTPRLISIDLPGSLRSLREEGVLYDATDEKRVWSGGAEKGVWSGGVDVFETEPVPRNEFLKDLEEEERGEEGLYQTGGTEKKEVERSCYDLDSSVEVWTDFLRPHLHPKSLLMIPGHFHNDSNDSFGPFPSGLATWSDRKFRVQLEDQLHFFVEECDSLQGFHLLSDWLGGFGGLASCIAEDLRDEYGTKGILTFLSSPLDTPFDKQPKYYPLVMNSLLSLSHLCRASSAVVPLSLLDQPWLRPTSLTTPLSSPSFNPALWYHSSAVFASALETATLFYRTHHNLTTLPILTDTLTTAGRKICCIGVSLPFSLPPHGNLASQLTLSPLPSSLSPLSPFAHHHDSTLWSLATSLRGTPSNYPLSSGEELHYSHPSHVLAVHLSETVPSVNSLLCCVEKPLPLATPFPRILPNGAMKTGHTPVCASLQTQSSSKHLLLSLLSLLTPSRTRQYPVYAEGCLDTDHTDELIQSVSSLADCYSVGEPLSDDDYSD